MKGTLLLLAAALCLSSCNKMAEAIIDQTIPASTAKFVNYTIRAGQHYCEGNQYRNIETSEQRFTVRFDSSAVYRTIIPANQYDINKLFGFSDNNAAHHQYSARFGWRWNDGALRLFAYVYNDGVVSSEELATIPLDTDIQCSIKIAGNKYVFRVNESIFEMPRKAITEKAIGYQLYPYFGGDETAPHMIN
ncbi:MAG: hypothetical protein ACXWV0_05005, partial [Flavisolibacter sp.]